MGAREGLGKETFNRSGQYDKFSFSNLLYILKFPPYLYLHFYGHAFLFLVVHVSAVPCPRIYSSAGYLPS